MSLKFAKIVLAGALVAGVLVAWSAPVRADDTSNVQSVQDSSKKWALQFSIEDKFQLEAFNGGSLSLKRQSSERRAWRLGVSTRVESTWLDNLSGSQERDDFTVVLALPYDRLFYPRPGGPVDFYYGFGLRPSWSHWRIETRSNGQTSSRSERDDLGVGITFTLGVEWQFTESLSLLGEYGSIIQYIWSRREDRSPTSGIRGQDSDVIKLDWERVRFGLTAYW